MIIFDPSKLQIHAVKIKSVSSASGGILTLTDQDKLVKKQIPASLARKFIKYYGLSKFWTPKSGYILTYENHILAIELKVPETPSNLITNLMRINSIINTNDIWMFDGHYIYKYIEDITSLGFNSFFVQPTMSIPVFDIGFEPGVCQEKRYCVGYQVARQSIMSPPIWKTFDESSDDIGLPKDFDTYNDNVFVNLNFAIYAGKKLVEIFDYSVIDPLMLPELIIDMRTINLDGLPSEVKYITSVHMSFKDAFAWCLGLMTRITNLTELMVVRSVLRYLVSKCCVSNSTIEQLL